MAKQQIQFNERLHLLSQKHQAMARGYTTQMRPDGLIVAQPRRRQVRISGRAVFLFLLAFIGFKAFLVANLGLLTYEDRLGRLNAGTKIEQAGAFVMQADPLTMFVASKIGPVLR